MSLLGYMRSRYVPDLATGENVKQGFACSSVRNGNFYGRNLDLDYADVPEFVIKVAAKEGRYASIGMAAMFEIKSNEVDKLSEALLLELPNMTFDGINANGIVMHIHAVGNKGVNRVVNAYINGGKAEMRNTIVHLRNVNEPDYKRMADNNIYVTSGMIWHHYSDAELENGNTWWPEELVTREQALTAMTINCAKQMFIEDERGSIKEGKYADFLLVDKDVLTCPVTEIHTARPEATYFEGKKVFSK